jgi:hypothetical protein
MSRWGWALLALVASVALPAEARRVVIPSYAELRDKADLIVVARPTTRTTDTPEITTYPGIGSQDRDGKQSQVPAVGVETRFEILAVLKGRRPTGGFTLHHYREDTPSDTVSVSGAVSLRFDPDHDQGGPFLMFLMKETDGRYTPYGAPADPQFSVFRLDRPE